MSRFRALDANAAETIGLVSATLAICGLGAVIAHGHADSATIAAVVLAGLVVLSAASPGGALGGSILAVPTAFILHPFPVGSFSLLEVAIVCMTVGLGARTVAAGRTGLRAAGRSMFTEIAVVLPALAILPAAGLAYAMLPDGSRPDVALREIRVTLVEPLMLLAAALMVMRVRETRRWAWVCVATIGTVIGAGACVQVLGGIGGVETGALTRATGIYSHPNNLALFLERTLLISFPMILLRPRHPLLWLALGLQLAGIGLTFSRGALLAVTVGVSVALVLLGKRRWLKVGAALSLGIGAVLFVIGRERLLDAGGTGAEPTRFAIWRSSLRMVIDHPVFGVGPDQFLYQYGRRYIEPSAWPERYTSHPHNLLFDVWLRLGAAGVGVFATLLAGLWRFVLRKAGSIRNDAIACGAVAALAGGAAHGLLDNGFFLPDLAAMTWIAIAMVLTVDTSGPGIPASKKSPDGR